MICCRGNVSMMSTQDKNVSMYHGFVDMFCGYVQCLYMNLLIGMSEMAELSATLYEQLAEVDQLEATIKKNLEVLGYGE